MNNRIIKELIECQNDIVFLDELQWFRVFIIVDDFSLIDFDSFEKLFRKFIEKWLNSIFLFWKNSKPIEDTCDSIIVNESLMSWFTEIMNIVTVSEDDISEVVTMIDMFISMVLENWDNDTFLFLYDTPRNMNVLKKYFL